MPRRHHHNLHPLWIQKVFRIQEHPAAGKTTAASRVPSTSGSLGACLWKQWRDHELVDSRIRIQETCANLDRECCSNSFQFTVKGEDEIEITNNVVHSFREREHLHKIHERKFDSAVRGELMAQRKLYEGEQKLRRASGRREILTAHFKRSIKN